MSCAALRSKLPLKPTRIRLTLLILCLIVAVTGFPFNAPLTTFADGGPCDVLNGSGQPGGTATIADSGQSLVLINIGNISGGTLVGFQATIDSTDATITGAQYGGTDQTTTYFKAAQPDANSAQVVYRAIGAGSTDTNSQQIGIYLTPNKEFGPVPITISVGNSGYNNPLQGVAQCNNTFTVQTQDTGAPAVPAPDAPTLSGTTGDGQNVLTWNSVTNAASYTLYQGANVIYQGTGTTYTQTGLTDGTAYSYTVTATDATGTSPSSNSLSLTPVAPAPPPTPPKDDITPRDEQLIALFLASFIGYKFISLFRWRSNV